MDGHFERAAAALMAAAEQAPVEHLAEAADQLDAVVTLAHEAGGAAGDQLAASVLAIQERLRDEASALVALRDQLTAAASQALAFDG